MPKQLLVAVLLCLLFVGCSRGPRIVPVRGKITLDGQPVKDADVMFVSQPGGRLAVGKTDAAGKYSLSTHPEGNGALEGEHSVVVSSFRDETTAGTNTPEGAVSGSSLVKIVWLVPEKYSKPNGSGLTATVKRGQQEYDFELKSEP